MHSMFIGTYNMIRKTCDIKILVMDVDGTLTDGKIYMGECGEVFKAFDVKDGCGIHDILPKYNIMPVIITARESKILANRCKELNISEVYQGCKDKIGCLMNILSRSSEHNREFCTLNNVAYIGDDILDLQCMKPIKEAGGIVGCPVDAVDEVKAISNFICSKSGGNGAVREFIDWIASNFERDQFSSEVIGK